MRPHTTDLMSLAMTVSRTGSVLAPASTAHPRVSVTSDHVESHFAQPVDAPGVIKDGELRSLEAQTGIDFSAVLLHDARGWRH